MRNLARATWLCHLPTVSGELEISPCRDMIWVVYDYLWSIIMMAFDRSGLILSVLRVVRSTWEHIWHLDRRYLRKLMVRAALTVLESTVFRFHIFHQQRRHRTSVIILHIISPTMVAALRAASASVCYIIFLPELGISDSASVCFIIFLPELPYGSEQHSETTERYLPEPTPVLMWKSGYLPKPQELTGRTYTEWLDEWPRNEFRKHPRNIKREAQHNPHITTDRTSANFDSQTWPISKNPMCKKLHQLSMTLRSPPMTLSAFVTLNTSQ
jgi:hypothetical protein